jgi:hypothetical protein
MVGFSSFSHQWSCLTGYLFVLYKSRLEVTKMKTNSQDLKISNVTRDVTIKARPQSGQILDIFGPKKKVRFWLCRTQTISTNSYLTTNSSSLMSGRMDIGVLKFSAKITSLDTIFF